MVNKTFLPTVSSPPKNITHSEITIFQTGTAFAEYSANRGLGEPRFASIRHRPGRAVNGSSSGENTVENALLIGLSRQTVLERQLDVVANNIANVNTTGFKADQSLFQEYLSPGAHEDNFIGRDRRESYVQDRGTYRDFS